MKQFWLIPGLVTMMLASCVVGPDSFALVPTPVASPTPDHAQYADAVAEYDFAVSSNELVEFPSGRLITVISMEDLGKDSWLLGWATEAALKDLLAIAGEGSPDDEWFPMLVWLYANGFAASELRCARERRELGDLIESFATEVREKRPDTTLHHMVVANTLWKQLPVGEADCSSYLADLPAEEFIAVLVDDMMQFYMGPFPARFSGKTEELFEEGDRRITEHALYDYYSREDVSVISPYLMKADAWLHSWAKEAVLRDSEESHGGWIGEWWEKAEWMYANGFVASERRCAEGREELADLIETYAAIIRTERPEEISHYRMSVAHTLWQTLPKGDTDCGAYLSELAVEDYMPLLVGNVVYYGFGW